MSTSNVCPQFLISFFHSWDICIFPNRYRATIKQISRLWRYIFSQRKKGSKIADILFEKNMPSVQKCHRRWCTNFIKFAKTRSIFKIWKKLSSFPESMFIKLQENIIFAVLTWIDRALFRNIHLVRARASWPFQLKKILCNISFVRMPAAWMQRHRESAHQVQCF